MQSLTERVRTTVKEKLNEVSTGVAISPTRLVKMAVNVDGPRGASAGKFSVMFVRSSSELATSSLAFCESAITALNSRGHCMYEFARAGVQEVLAQVECSKETAQSIAVGSHVAWGETERQGNIRDRVGRALAGDDQREGFARGNGCGRGDAYDGRLRMVRGQEQGRSRCSEREGRGRHA